MRNIIGVFLILFSCSSIAQKHSDIKRTISNPSNLNVGDLVPDVLIERIINNESSSARISDFKDQLLILDFWATNCSGCVAALPKMETLQKKFGNKIKILPVTFESEIVTSSFLKNNRLTKNLNIPSVVSDKILSKWFKHRYLSHEVWIYKGRVVALTGSDYVDADNISSILAGKKNSWPIKYDFYPEFDYSQPLLSVNEKHPGIKNNLTRSKAIFGYLRSAASKQGFFYDSLRCYRRSYIINSTILGAYFNNWGKIRDLTGWSKRYFPYPNQILLEVKDPSKYSSIKTAKYLELWKQEHLICYESISRIDGKEGPELYREIINDLDYLLNLHGRYENRKVKCLVLIKEGRGDEIKLKSKGGKSEFIKDGPEKRIHNISLGNFVETLNQEVAGLPPLFDETGYQEMIDMSFRIDSWTNISAFRDILRTYGFDLKEEERDLEMFVLTEKGTATTLQSN